jgi:hypothetical protein
LENYQKKIRRETKIMKSKLLAENDKKQIQLFQVGDLFFVLETELINDEHHIISASDKLPHDKAKEIFDNLCEKNFR